MAFVLYSMVEREAREQARARALLREDANSSVRFDTYMRHGEIEEYLKELAVKYPSLVTLQSVGKSYEGREMTAIRVSLSGGSSPRAVLVDAGIHAREWIAPATALYLINRLVEHTDQHRDLLQGLDWYILPVVNPDGYEYTHTKDRFWRKNRGAKRETWLKWLWDLLCEPGADLNRNFGFHWMQSGASTFPCAETFAGKKAFSEVESQNVRDYILSVNKDKRVKMYLTLHSYGPVRILRTYRRRSTLEIRKSAVSSLNPLALSVTFQMILYPWGYDYRVEAAPDAKELADIGNEANAAMVKAGSVPFKVENSADLYPAAGGSDDWAKGVADIAKSYTIELHGGGSNGFDLPASKILTSVQQTFEGLKVFASRAQQL
ncbi:Carboxypeptidase B [Frankliniella fusca]|uniref:Carboxypeptidase B n=1 Tax=Frankliniella fusca TaxID=407009 RepID=A0AAE1LCV2_9NEOP|nr:Carboxypeptidase B [Frankliniella fusca]